MKNFLLISFTLFVLGTLNLFGQTQVVQGVVVDENNEPIVGASVIIKGTSSGISTDLEGKFTISVPADTKLVISSIGAITQEVSPKPKMKIVLQSSVRNLDEVVVTAMGISKSKKSIGYATQEIKSDIISQAASSDLSSALQGKVSGIEINRSSGMPGASAKITIRGSRSFTGDNTPLYVIDGMPISSSSDVSTFNSVTGTDFANRAVDINPDDIESVNVLKGQAASALYGMRASNGVVLIITKKGAREKKSKPTITFSSNVAYDKISVLPKFQKEFAQGVNGDFVPNSSFSWGPKISDLASNNKYGGSVDNDFTQQYGKHEGQYYVPQRAAAGLDPWATPQVYDNAKNFFKTGTSWSNNVNIAQAFDYSNYSFSLGNTNTNGIIPNTGLDRYNARLSAEIRWSDKWKSGFNGSYINTKIKKQTSANNSLLATVYGSPASYDMNGIPQHIKGNPYVQNNYRGGFDAAYWAIDNNQFVEQSHRFFGNSYLDFATNLGSEDHHLDVKYQLGVDSYTTNYIDSWGYGSRAYSNGQVENYDFIINEYNSLLTANYTWSPSANFRLNLLLGNEFVEKRKKYVYGLARDYNFPGWNHADNATFFNTTSSFNQKRTVGTFANISIDYLNMLYFNATIRNDKVSSMPRNNRSFTYPSVSLGFIFTEIENLKNKVLSFGKIRVSYAEVGQAGNYLESYYSIPVYGGGFYSGTPIAYPFGPLTAYTPYRTIYDPNLKPQNTSSYEIGTDLTFFDGLFSLNYTYSRQNVKNQIFEVPLDGATGYSELVTNGGKIHTNAHELTLSVSPINTNYFKWDFSFNYTKIDNYVDELAEGVTSIFLGGFVTPQVRASINDKFPVIYGRGLLRNKDNKMVVDEDGFPIAGEDKVIGYVSPDFRLGFNNNITLYKFKLSALFDWKQGGSIYAGTNSTLNIYGVTQESADLRKKESFVVEDAVKYKRDATGAIVLDEKGDPQFLPNDIAIKGADAFSYYNALGNADESAIQENSFIKLREISLSYPVLEKDFCKINLSLFARNIILWSTYKGLDPESTQGNTNMAGAFERFSLPGTSSYGFGLTFTF